MNVKVIINTHAGEILGENDSEGDDLDQKFRAAGLEPEIARIHPSDLKQALRQAVREKWQTVVVGGGDGTINTAARTLAGSESRLAIIPLGTFNYFARFLNIPFDLDATISMISQNHWEEFDAVEVNGRMFISHASLGIFSRYIMERVLLQRKRKWWKLPAMVMGLVKSLLRFPVLKITVEIKGESKTISTPFLLIGNNSNMISPLFSREDSRPYLQDGKFSLFLIKHDSRFKTSWAILKALFGHINLQKDFWKLTLQECQVSTPKKSALLTLDGELVRLEHPLHFKVLPKVLQLYTPAHD